MIKYVFLDFNGTVLDDVDLCHSLLNDLLKSQNKAPIDLDSYKEVFGFPIKSYYERAGLDFSIRSFDEMAVEFIAKYQPRSLECQIYDGLIEVVDYLKNKGIKVILFTASEKNNVMSQLNHFGIAEIFDDILSNDNIYAASKEAYGIKYIKDNGILSDEAVFVGDTDHDYLCAKAMNIKSILVSSGHQSKKSLSKLDAVVIDDIKMIKEIL